MFEPHHSVVLLFRLLLLYFSLKDDYLEAVNGIEKSLVKETPKKNLLYIGELKGGSRNFVPKMVCVFFY